MSSADTTQPASAAGMAEADGTNGSINIGNGPMADPLLLDWLRDRIQLPSFDPSTMWHNEHDVLASNFLLNRQLTRLLAVVDPDLGLRLLTTHVGGVKSSGAQAVQYFIKLSDEPSGVIINERNIHVALLYGVTRLNGKGPGPSMEALLRLMQGVYLPTFLSNGTWPDSIKKELSGQLHKFMASLTETTYALQGHTVLYLPDEDLQREDARAQRERIEEAAKDKELVQRLESTLIHWTRQIKEVVSNQETSHHVDNSGPLEEIAFWRSRTLDLSGIKTQLDRDGVKLIVQVLTLAGSSYLTPFISLSNTIEEGSREANNNLKFLATLQEPCQRLAEAHPRDIPDLLPEILNLIRIIWSASKYYNTDERLTGLLRKVSNQIIVQCSAVISLEEIFAGDVANAMQELRMSIACGKAWHQAYDRTVQAISRDPSTPSKHKWNFDPSTHGIFAQMDAFVQRCHNLIEVCEGQMQFARKGHVINKGFDEDDQKKDEDDEDDEDERRRKRARARTGEGTNGSDAPSSANTASATGQLDLPAFGGSRGAEIEKSLFEIEAAFDKHITRLRHLDYNILNVKATSWHSDYNYFKTGLKDLEVMMTNVISSAWEGISTVSAGVELLESFYSLAVRPGMKQSVERKVSEVYAMFAQEVRKVKTEFDRHKKEPPLPPGQPRFAGAALWAKALLKRIAADHAALTNAAYLCSNPHELEEATTNFQQLSSVLESYIRQCHLDWINSMHQASQEHATLSDRLNRPLMNRSGEEGMSFVGGSATRPIQKGGHSLVARKSTGHLESNFDKHLLRLFNEVRYWEKFHGDFPIPYIAHEMYLQQDALRVLRESVMLVVRDYNTIIDALSNEERRLFQEHLRRVDRKISPGLNKLSWAEKHIKDWFVKTCRTKCQEVYDLVLLFKEHNERINLQCARIADTLLVDIEKNVVYDSVSFEARQIRHQSRCKLELEAAHAIIVETMQSSYEFFLDHPPEVQKEWAKYVKKIDQKVEDALRTTVKRSLQELSRAINGDNKTEPHALFKVNMVLDDSKGKVEFRPSMSDLSSMIKSMSRQSITTIQVVPRLVDIDMAKPQPKEEDEEEEKKEADEEEETKTAATATPAAPSKPLSWNERVALKKAEEERKAKEAAEAEEKARLAAAAEEAKVAREKARRSFYDVISNDEDILKILVNIMHGTTNVAVDLGKIISHYDRYAPIWNTDKAAFIRRYANTKRPLASFDMDITRYKNNQQDIQSEDPAHTVNFIRVDCTMLKASLVAHCQQWQSKLTNLLHHNANTELMALHEYFVSNTTKLQQKPEVLDKLAEGIQLLTKLQSESASIEARFDPIEATYKCLDKFDVPIGDEEKDLLDHLRTEAQQFQHCMSDADAMLKLKMVDMKKELEDNLVSYNQHVIDTRTEFKEHGPFSAPGPGEGDPDVAGALEFIADFKKRLADNRARADAMKRGMEIFNIEQPEYKETDETEKELLMLERVWLLMKEWLEKWNGWRTQQFSSLVVKELDTEAESYQKQLNKLGRAVRQWKVWQSLYKIIQRFRQTMPLITNLRSPAMRDRHWEQLRDEIQQSFDPYSEEFTLDKVFQLQLHLHADIIANLALIASRELTIETNLAEIARIWKTQPLDITSYKSKYYVVKTVDEINDQLETHQMTLSTMKNSPYYLTFSSPINEWVTKLNDLVETLEALMTVQRQWRYLESIFLDSADIRKQLPAESAQFESVHTSFVDIMMKLSDSRRVLQLTQDDLLSRLNHMNQVLDRINHSLDQYLEKKRQLFPRFYFLSNDDLLEILGNSREPNQVNKHIRKCFAGIKVLDLVAPNKSGGGNKLWDVVGMISAEGEEVRFNSPVVVEGEVETWLTEVEKAMQECLQKLLYVAITHVQKASHKKSALENWVKTSVGQLLIVSGQIGWTAKCAAALADLAKNKRSMRRLKSEWHDYLNKLARYVRMDLDTIERLKLCSLITIEVHARDVIDRLKQASKNKVGVNSFEWTSQLRFYFDKPQGDFGKCVVKQTNTSFNYGYEYIGNAGRLVITPLTDRCYMTLTTALHLCRGGSPQGPAGTGKTETVKDLGKGLGKFVVVFNCSDTMGVESLGRNFSGLAQTGAWGCFDEFNRILIEVLSVVALQVTAILDACKQQLDTFTLDGRQIRIDRTVGIFITMNPGYAGRTELPDNLKSLFRPVAMMVPESEMIAEVILQSEGFKEAQLLAKKITTIYSLIDKQLSKQAHYAYGLRAIKSVLTRAGQLNRSKGLDLSEELVLMRALRDMNTAKLIPDDVFLFDSLLADVFPAIELPSLDYTVLKGELEKQMQLHGYQPHQPLIDKAIQLYESKGTRHGNMLVGGSLSGKSTAWKMLAAALTALHEKKAVGNNGQRFESVTVDVLNPKAIDTDEMFGNYDSNTKEWNDGILSNIMRRVCNSETSHEKWVMLDGPVDTLWIESMNTLLDDNKVLTLINGDRIAMPPQVTMMFEVEDLVQASPATVSRVGIVYLDQTSLGWRPFAQSWVAKKAATIQTKTNNNAAVDGLDASGASTAAAAAALVPTTTPGGVVWTKESVELLSKLFDKYVVPLLNYKSTSADVKELIPITDFNAVRSLTRLFDSLATPENGIDVSDEANYLRMIELWFTFCVVWSIGGALDEASRAKFDVFLRDLEAQFPPLQTCFEYYVDGNKKEWMLWEEKVNNAWRPPAHTPFFKILVPTLDTVRYQFLLSSLIKNRHNTLVCGVTGTGKTAAVESLLDSMDPNTILTLTLNFSAATTSEGVQESIESRLEKRQRSNYGPLGARSRLILFVDDLNMPRKSEYGISPPIEFLRQWADYAFWFDRSKGFKKNVLDMQMVAAMGPPGGARSDITPRLQSKFNLLHFTFPHDNQIKRIYRTLLNHHLSEFDEVIKPLGPVITQATLDLFKSVTAEFLPTPACCHYLFNLRDMSRVVQGLLRTESKYYDTRESMLRVWVHEVLRVFSDRLISEDDKDKFNDILNAKLNTLFETNWKKLFKENKVSPMFSDFLEEDLNTTSGGVAVTIGSANDTDDGEDRAPYVDLTNKMAKVKIFMEEALQSFNLDPENVSQDLVLFDVAIEHVARIYRIITQPRGSAMLIGVGGSGRRSLARLAAHIAHLRVKSIQPTARYRHSDFREDLKDLYKQTGLRQEATVFLLSDTQLVHEAMFEDVNSILNSGDVNKLFPPDELQPILEELRGDASKEGRSTSSDALAAYFIERVREKLHVVLCMSPVGAAFRNRVRMFPALVNCTTIDSFEQWPLTALTDVAQRYLQDLDVGGQKVKDSLAQVFCSMHTSSIESASRMLLELHRHNHITPTKYLDLVKTYRILLQDKRASITLDADKLRNGLDKLESSSNDVKELTIALEEKKKIVAQKKNTCDKLLVEIVQKQRAADEQKKQVELDKARAESEARECEAIKADAQGELDKVTPALDKAIKALEKLTKAAVTEVKSYPKPPKPVEKVMCAVMTILEKEASWAQAKKELNDPGFLNMLKTFDRDNISNATLKAISKYTKSKDFNPEDISNVSYAAGALCEWVLAIELYAKVFRDVEPRRIALRKAELSLKKKTDELEAAEEQLREVVSKVAKLQEVFQQSELEQTTLTNETKTLENKLAGAAKLVEGLGGEKVRWESSIKAYQNDIKNLVGDCAVAAAYIAYAGPFPSAYRDYLLKKCWSPQVRKLNLPFTLTWELQSFLSHPTDIMDWGIQGLPTDPTSVDNAVMIKSYMRWPLMIDPQGQANMWIKAHEAGNNLRVVDPQTPGYLNVLEQCMVYGTPLLLQDVGEELDASLDPVFRMTGLDQEKKSVIFMGDKELSYNNNFRLYITTKMQNPHYQPEVNIKTMVINFQVMEKGLQDQLLAIVVRMEEPKLENDKAELVRTVAAQKRKLVELEDHILTLLKTAGGDNNPEYSLVEDHDLINALQLSKTTSEEVKEKLTAAQETEQRIDAAREGYRACAVRAAMCFFVINDLSLVDPMYQFSLKAYVELFKHSIAASRGDRGGGEEDDGYGGERDSNIELVDRIANLNEFHTEAVYKYACRALFEKHKLIFSFQLCIQKMMSEEKIDRDEYDFFLRGGQVLDRSTRLPNPCPEWLTESSWDNITELDKLTAFKNIAHSFEQNAQEWRAWYRSDDPPPEKLQPPGDWQTNGKRDIFQQMLLLRCLRPDRVIFAARQFIAENLGPQFVESPPFDLADSFAASSSITPLIFVLSPGVDPLPMLQQLAKQHGNQPLYQISLGQGQAPLATELIEQGLKHGQWIFLANTHLSLQWLPTLDKIVERISLLPAKERHPNFRLWMSADPTPDFPISLLQNSVKMTTEPPKGLRANLQRLYANITEEQFNRCRKPEKYKKLLFSLCWFHAILVERKKFGMLGMNVAYSFNHSDFSVCENLLSIYLDEFEETPFDALKYLIAQANYGGRVTDGIDRRLLDVYSNQFFTEAAITVPRYPLSSLETYYIPEDGNLDHYRKYIASLPKSDADPPEAFGQHPNADIASQMADTKSLLSTILSLQPRTVVEGGKSREVTVLELSAALMDQIPQELNLVAIARAHEADKTPLTIVLLQEIDRYNKLLRSVRRSLRDLAMGVKGLVVISPALEEMMECLYGSVVPPAWHSAYPSLKPLGPWVRDLSQRINQLQRWASDDSSIKTFWLSGFTFPVGFLTALLQMSARKNGVSIESLTWDFVVMSSNESNIAMRPKEGAYIRGLYLEGARWDVENGCLAEPYPMELVCPMPIIHFKPVEQRKKSSKGLHACPAYIYPNRAGTQGHPSFLMEVDLKSGPRDSQFWTKRGVALLLSLSEQ